MKEYRCDACGKECEPIEQEEGGWEEIWGARQWHSQIVTVSDCCREGYEEINEDDQEDAA